MFANTFVYGQTRRVRILLNSFYHMFSNKRTIPTGGIANFHHMSSMLYITVEL